MSKCSMSIIPQREKKGKTQKYTYINLLYIFLFFAVSKKYKAWQLLQLVKFGVCCLLSVQTADLAVREV